MVGWEEGGCRTLEPRRCVPGGDGVKVLGTEVGSRRFVEEVVTKRLEEEDNLWEAIPSVPDLQASSCIVLVHVATTCYGPSHLPSPRSTHDHTIWRWHG